MDTFTPPMDTPAMLRNVIRIDNPDTPIYRVFARNRLLDTLREGKLWLASPRLWDDPFEDILRECCITKVDAGKMEQSFFDRVRRPVYAQCWSLLSESDAVWRIYSSVRRDTYSTRNLEADKEGMMVRTTARKLIQALWDFNSIDPAEHCFLGRVLYLTTAQIENYIGQQVQKNGLQAFSGGLGHAESLLFKRDAFAHEKEVRLVYVDPPSDTPGAAGVEIPIDPNAFFDEVVLDPRLYPSDVRDREVEVKVHGFKGPVRISGLYERRSYVIQV